MQNRHSHTHTKNKSKIIVESYTIKKTTTIKQAAEQCEKQNEVDTYTQKISNYTNRTILDWDS